MTVTLVAYAQFIKSAVGVNSLTVTWDVEQITRSTGARSALVTGGANGVTVGRRGLYGYVLAGADLSLYDYVFTAITAGDVDQKEVAGLWTSFSVADAAALANLDATITSRSTTAQILTTALTESYAADGAAGTLTQILYLIQQFLAERAVVGTTMTVKKLDGAATAATFTLNDATSPTAITRAT